MAKAKEKPLPKTFLWSGVNRENRKVSGQVEADNIQIAKLLLRRRGVKIKKIHKSSESFFSLGKKIKVKDITFLTRQLATMVQSGIPIAASLRGISMGHENAACRKLLEAISKDVEAGIPMSAALKKHPRHFNRLYTSLVAVGEESGTLDILMNNIATYLEKIEHIKGKIRSALFYPVLVVVVAVFIVSILLIVVIPEFESLFSDYGAELPALTRLMINASYTFENYWFIVLTGFMAAAVTLAYLYKRSSNVQYVVDRLILRVPVFGLIIRKAIIARISRTLATMFGAGAPLIDSLEIVSNAAGNRVYGRGLLKVRKAVSTGRTLGGSMMDTGLFPGMVLQMVATGEESGQLERMLNKVAEFYESEVDNAIAVISSLIEPFLIVVLGLIVGTIVTAMYLPIFKLGTVF